MNNRIRALAILKQARELLANRLIENIIDSADGILEDAEGSSYMDEIDSLQDRVGGRLNNINLMISNLTVGEPASAEPISAAKEASVSTPAPQGMDAPQPTNFAMFGKQIVANDIDAAGRTLAELLDVDPKLAQQCATAFRDCFNEDPTIIQKAMQLRARLLAGENHDSLMILWDCFRLQGPQALAVLQTLKARLSPA